MPINKAWPINLSSRQEKLLQQIVRGITNPYRLVRRAKLVLGASSGESNSGISRRLELDREQVRLWRERWREAREQLAALEEQEVTDKDLMSSIEQILGERPRPGTNKFFSTEQVIQIKENREFSNQWQHEQLSYLMRVIPFALFTFPNILPGSIKLNVGSVF